jgi:DNA polymerase-3 subunit delta'
MTAEEILLSPRARHDFLGAEDVEYMLAQALDAGALTNGWLIAGPEGVGKATLAYRLARALLAPDRKAGSGLTIAAGERTFALVASGGHPDLFVAERLFDEKKERHASEIAVETIRDLSHFLSHTAAMGGWRVAIIDTADDLNRNAANALLKALEEPPARTAIFVLSSSPGRLLATIRSRCRRIDLRPVSDELVAAFLEREGAATGDNARRIAIAAKGRPGYALTLAAGEGAAAIEAVEEFWTATARGGDVGELAARLSAKGADCVWPLFQSMLIDRLASLARRAALENASDAVGYADLREALQTLFTRGDAVNLDRFQVVLAAARAFSAARLRLA